jgi:hypothetical protein
MSFDPISLLVLRFKSSIRLRRTCGFKLSPAAILNQNPIFEMGYSGCQKNDPIAGRFFVTTTDAAILFSEHNYDKRYDLFSEN